MDATEDCDAANTGWTLKVVVYPDIKKEQRITVKRRVTDTTASIPTEAAKFSLSSRLLLATKFCFILHSSPQTVLLKRQKPADKLAQKQPPAIYDLSAAIMPARYPLIHCQAN